MVSHALLQIALAILLSPIVIVLHLTVGPRIQNVITQQPGWLQFFEAVLVADIAFYWAHRVAHQVPFLWKFHSVHHSSEQLDWLASTRVHPLDQAFVKAIAGLALLVLGFSRATFGSYLALTTFQALFVHANVRLKFGPLRWLIATPAYHHWHHANEAEATNRNFGGQFPWIDAMFGTLYMPDRMPARYGTDREVPSTYIAQLAYPFRSQALP